MGQRGTRAVFPLPPPLPCLYNTRTTTVRRPHLALSCMRTFILNSSRLEPSFPSSQGTLVLWEEKKKKKEKKFSNRVLVGR